MTSPLSNELLFGTRALLRDTPWSQWRLRALQRNAAMTHAGLAALQPSLLHKTLRSAFSIIDKDTLLTNRHSLHPNGGARQAFKATSGTTGAPLDLGRLPRRHGARQPARRPGDRHGRQVAAVLVLEPLQPAVAGVVAPPERRAHRRHHRPSRGAGAGLLERRGRCLRIARVFTSSERVACASACEHGQLHVNPDYAYVETVDGEGDVVGTTFHHHAMPLLRYRSR